MSDQKVSYIILRDTIVFNFDFTPYTVQKNSADGIKCLAALKEKRLSDIPRILAKEKYFKESLTDTIFDIRAGVVYVDNEPVNTYVSNKIMEFYNAGLPYIALVNFWKRLKANPSKNSVNQLYSFLEVNECPITPEGLFVAQKGVRATKDPNIFEAVHVESGQPRFQYILGTHAYMPREEVVDDPDNACGAGLHVGSFSYAKAWGPVILEMLVDPADVVSVPTNSNAGKLRAWRVLPVAVHVGGVWRGGVAIEATKKEAVCTPIAKSTVISTVEITNTKEVLTISDVAYCLSDIDEEVYNKIIDEAVTGAVHAYGIQRYRPSKAPAAIRRICTDALLVEAYKFKFVNTNAPLFIFKREVGSASYTLLYPKDEMSDVSEVVDHYVEKVPVIKESVFAAKYPVAGIIPFNGEQFEVVYLPENRVDIAAFVEVNSEYVERVLHIKPSKVPINLSRFISSLSSGQVYDVKRLFMIDGSIVFVMHLHVLDEQKTLLMRKE